MHTHYSLVLYQHQMRSNYQQGLQEPTQPNIICTMLTPEEVQIALSYLKRRFSNYPLELVVSTLDHYIHQKPSAFSRKNNRQAFTESTPRRKSPKPTQPERNEEIHNELGKDEKRKKAEQRLKVVAALFCEQGYDYHKANRLMPQINQSHYRNALICIVNSVFNQLLTLLKQQCRMELQVTTFQKSLIRQQLLYSHKWMGLMSVSALTTFFKLIQKKFQKIKVNLTDDQLIELYSIIAKRLTDNNVNLSQMEAPTTIFDKQAQIQRNAEQGELTFSQQDLLSLAKCFLEEESILNTLKALQRSGKKQWSCRLVEGGLQVLIKKSIKKLTNTIIRIEQALREIIESDFSQNIHKDIMEKGEMDLKLQIVKYYLAKKPTRQQSEKMVGLIYKFVRSQSNHQLSQSFDHHPEVEYQKDFGVSDHEWQQAEQIIEIRQKEGKESLDEDQGIQWLIE